MMPSALPTPMASSLTDSGGVGRGTVSTSQYLIQPQTHHLDYWCLFQDHSGIIHPPLIYYFKPNTFSKTKTLLIWTSCFIQATGVVTHDRSGIWKSWVFLEELEEKKNHLIISKWGQPAQLEKAAGCRGLLKDHLASLPDPEPSHCLSSSVLERKKKIGDMCSALLRSQNMLITPGISDLLFKWKIWSMWANLIVKCMPSSSAL